MSGTTTLDQDLVRILLIADDRGDCEAITRHLQKPPVPYRVQTALTPGEARRLLGEAEFDVAIVDFGLGEGTGPELLPDLGDTPTIVLIAKGGERTAAESLRGEPCDYLIKDGAGDYLALLPLSIENALARNRAERKFLDLLESALDAMVIVDSHGAIVLVNAQTETLFGYGRDEILGRPVELLMPRRYRENHAALRERFFDEPAARPMSPGLDLYATRKDGSEFPVEISLSSVESREGMLTIAAIRDVTARKRAEERLQTAERRYRTLFEQLPDAVVIIDPETTRPIEFNDLAPKLLGYSRHEFAQLRLSDYEAIETAAEVTAHVEMVVGSRKDEFETKMRTKQGATVDVRVSVRTVDLGGKTVLHSIFRDITERKRAEAELRLAAEITQHLAEGVSLIRASDGTLVFVNPALTEMFGYDPGEMIGQQVTVLNARGTKTPEETAAEIKRGLNENGFWCGEVHNVKKNGTAFWTRAHVSVFEHVQHGTVWVTVQEDITERKRANEQARAYHSLLDSIARIQRDFITDAPTDRVFGALLDAFLSASESEYGLVGEVLTRGDGAKYVKTHAISDIAWNEETRKLYDEQAPQLEFENLESLFGKVITTGKAVIANDPASDPRACGTPPGHPPLNAFLGLPLHSGDRMVGMVGIANRRGGYDEALVEYLGPLMATCSYIIEANRNDRQRRKAEDALRLTQFSVDHAADAVFWVRPDASFAYVNDTACRSLGYSSQELHSMSVHDIDPLFPPRKWSQQWSDTWQAESMTFESVHRRKNGDTFHVEITTNHLEFGGTTYHIASAHDITERKQAEKAIQEKEEQLDSLLSNVGVIVLEGDPFNFYYVGGQVERLLGYRRELWFEDPDGPIGFWSKHLHPDDEDKIELCRRAIESGRDHAFEYRMIAADGREVWFYDTVTVETENGRPVKTRSVMVDITERKLAEEQARLHREELAHVARVSTMGEMAAGLAHEINQPLTALVNYAEVCARSLKSGDADTEKLYEHIQQMSAQAVRASEIVRRLRSFVQKTGPRRSTANLNDLVREVAALVGAEARSSGATVELNLDEELACVFCDSIQIEQVILNLVRNGLDALGGTETEDRRLTIRTAQVADAVEVAVSDNGPGLPPGAELQVFDSFFTTKPDGLGLGLSISRSIVEAHDGRLWATPNADRGVTFRVRLPLCKEGDDAT